MTKTCPVCGKEFEPIHGRQRYCGKACYKVGNRESVRNYKKKLRMNNLLIKACPVCGKEFVVTRGRRYCSKDCQRKAHRVSEKACPVCGVTFTTARGRRYCSAACARIANNTNTANRRKAAALAGQSAREARQVMREKRDRAYEALGVKVTTSVVNGRTVEWRGQKVCGMKAISIRVKY